MRPTVAILALAVVFSLVGCVQGEATVSGAEDVQKEMSRESYEKAMIDAGKGDELEKEKAKMEERAAQGG